MNTKPQSSILWTGPSLLDGAPLVVVGILQSSNTKTGNMLQTYILRADMAPIEASRTGADASICGDCKHRQGQGGACYVTLAHGPSSVWRALQRGAYPSLLGNDPRPGMPHTEARQERLAAFGAGRMVRLGTYGDPAAVPAWVWQALVSRAAGRTGYTHQWANLNNTADWPDTTQRDALKALVMASVDTPAERAQALTHGWRTFRIRTEAEPLQAREFTCPASEEAGKRLQCSECGACDGSRGPSDGRASVAIVVHGSLKRRFVPIVPA